MEVVPKMARRRDSDAEQSRRELNFAVDDRRRCKKILLTLYPA